MVLERQIFLQKEGRYSVQHVLHYPTVPMKVKSPALIWDVNLGCLSMAIELTSIELICHFKTVGQSCSRSIYCRANQE